MKLVAFILFIAAVLGLLEYARKTDETKHD